MFQFLTCFLAFRINTTLPGADDMLSLDSISRSWWCYIRIAVAFFACAGTYLFDTHPLVRIYVSEVAFNDICNVGDGCHVAVMAM